MSGEEKTLGNRLQLARKRAGLTQQELCQKTGLSYSTVAKIERGAIKSPSIFTVGTIAATTGTSIEELLGGFIKNSPAPPPSKKVSKTGVKFVYFDISGVLTNFTHKIFADIAKDARLPLDNVETSYWRYNDQLNKSKITLSELNKMLGKIYGLPDFDWEHYYFRNLSALGQGRELFDWVSANYEVGLMSNHIFIEKMQQKGFVPSIGLSAVIDSSKEGYVKPEEKIYKIAQKRAGVIPQEILLIDNERPNLIAADRLGWQTTWFDELHPTQSSDRIKKLLEF